MSHWSSQLTAELYAKGRPYFHSSVIHEVSQFLRDFVPFDLGLDIGCGTGLSSVALKSIASEVRGIDISSEMLSHAPKVPNIEFVYASGEAIPFYDNTFNIITLSQSFHWLDRKKFFNEARRVLKPRSWIVVYDNYFSAMLQENPDFSSWWKKYIMRYPTPPRPKVEFTSADAEAEGFDFVSVGMHEEWPEFTKESLIAYLLTQSNISAAIEGNESIESIADWMREELSSFIPEGSIVHIGFGSPIWYLRLLN